MNATATLPPEVAAYLDQVRAALADVPGEERDEMLADLEVSLLEGAADSAESPEARLGPPERFANELRAAAGIEAPPPAAAAPRGLRARGRARLHAFAASPRGRSAAELAYELAPAWWVARGYVAAYVFALVSGLNVSGDSRVLPVHDAPFFGLLLVLAGVSASVWLGRRTRREGIRRRRVTALNVALAVLALPVAIMVLEGPEPQFVEVGYGTGSLVEHTQGLVHDGEQIRNLYPYSRDGELLLDVLLYDEFGHAVELGSANPQDDPQRRYLFTKGGQPVLNSFPIRYVEPGSTKVENPRAAPKEIEVPEIETPPLTVEPEQATEPKKSRRGKVRRP